MKFQFFNLYHFVQDNLNGIFSECVCVSVCVHGLFVCPDREKRRERQREKNLLLINLADSHQCSFVRLSCGKRSK